MAMKQRSRIKHGGIPYSKLDKESDNDENDALELRKPPSKLLATMEVVIDPEDTLQAIALRYHCNVAEIKRLNFIHRENEIHAKRTIKVPIVPHSLLTETITEVHSSGNSTPVKILDVSVKPGTIEQTLCDNLVKINGVAGSSSATSNGLSDLSLDDIIDQGDNLNLSRNEVLFKGDDCGMSWLLLITFALLFIVVCPLIYIFFLEEHPEIMHHHYHSHH